MPEQPIREARGLVQLALRRIEDLPSTGIHTGILGHLKGARTQLDAACALLLLVDPSVPPDPEE